MQAMQVADNVVAEFLGVEVHVICTIGRSSVGCAWGSALHLATVGSEACISTLLNCYEKVNGQELQLELSACSKRLRNLDTDKISDIALFGSCRCNFLLCLFETSDLLLEAYLPMTCAH